MFKFENVAMIEIKNFSAVFSSFQILIKVTNSTQLIINNFNIKENQVESSKILVGSIIKDIIIE